MKNKNDGEPKFKIQKGIPMPLSTARSRWPWRELKIGDSFLVSSEDDPSLQVRAAASYFAKRNPEYKFMTRREGAEIRVWRVACEPKL